MQNNRRVFPKPFNADNIAQTKYDLLVATTGFESRAIWVAENLSVSAVELWAPAFANRQSLQFENNKRFFKSLGYDTEVCRESEFYFELANRITKLAASITENKALRILVDVSSMSRLRMASVVDAVRFAKCDQELQCDFIYSLAEFSEPHNENLPISEFGPVTDAFAGWSDDPSKSCSVLFGAGYEEDQIIGVVEMLEADDVWVFVPHGPDERYYASVLEGNRALWDVVPENRRLNYSVMRPFDTFSAIESLIYGKLATTRPMIVPFGPKIFSIVSMIAAAMHQPEVAIWRVSTGQSETPIDRKGTDQLSGISMISSVQSKLENLLEFDYPYITTGTHSVENGGYDAYFLSKPVPVPGLSTRIANDAFEIFDSPLIHYTHFSVCQSKSRRLPRFVAWNIDGRSLKHLPRNDITFMLDNRVPDQYQAGNELYANNQLDRRQIALRADLVWGTLADAEKANRDSFFYTNIAPQLEAHRDSLAGRLWGDLENAIFDEVNVEGLKVSVIGGPIFRDGDVVYRNFKIPADFWKVIAFGDADSGNFKVAAYIVRQKKLPFIDGKQPNELQLYQVSLNKLAEETGLDFDSIREFDVFARLSSITNDIGSREISSRAQLLS